MVRSQPNYFDIKKLDAWLAEIKIYKSCIEAEVRIMLSNKERMKLKYLAIRKPMKLKYLCQDKSREATLAHYQYQA